MATRKQRSKNTLEMLSDHIRRIERFSENVADLKVIVSSDFTKPLLKEDLGIQKVPISWPLYKYNMFFVVSVPARTVVPSHVHDEDVFRYVLEGTLKLNGRKIKAGEWFVVRAGTTYRIFTDTGYKAISGYTSICRTRRGMDRTQRRQPQRG